MRTVLMLVWMATACSSLHAKSERRFESAPAVSVETSVTAGGAVFTRESFEEFEAVKLLDPGPREQMPAGSILILQSYKKKLVACSPVDPRGLPCLVDAERDGSFSSWQFADAAFGFKMKPQVRYELGHIYRAPDSEGTFRQQLSFLGVSGNTLRLSYREFSNDMARPAFTDEVTFTLSGKFPETIAYKDVVIDVLGISNAGMRYVVRKAADR